MFRKLPSRFFVAANIIISSTIKLLTQTWFLLARKGSRREGQLDDFDQNMNIGNAVSERQENVMVNEGTNDRDFTFGTFSNNSVVNGNAMNAETLERCFNERINRETSNIVNTYS